ncbi:MAG: tRNA pseudouridine(38-40) synthase TruA [Gammaproteobacteria bacterium]
MRVALGVEYDGRRFGGFQFQRGIRTIQSELERALSDIADAPIRVLPAGRTDAGVHAREQVIHFDTHALRSTVAWREGTNSRLPQDVSVRWANEVPPDFHARRSALMRSYRYRILVCPSRPALEAGRVFWSRRTLDVEAMRAALVGLEGEHDFSAFRAAGCQSHSSKRRLDRLALSVIGPEIILEVSGNAFLYHMVRNLAGSLLEIGRKRQSRDWLRELLAGRDRTRAGPTLPADGLYLWEIRYPERFGLEGSRRDACVP